MIRHKILPAVCAAALLTLGACGSTAGTPTPAASVSSAVSTPSATSSAAPESSTESAAASSDTATGTGSESSSTAVTVDGTMDAQSEAWFGSMCDGVTPMIEAVFGAMGSLMDPSAGSDPSAVKKAQTTLADAFAKAGDSMAAAGAKMSTLPPPSIDHGAEISAEASSALAKAGPALKQVAEAVRTASVTSMQELSSVMEKATSGMESSLGDLSLSSFELSDAMQAQVAKIPACAPLMQLGSLGDTASAAPTS